MLAYACDHILLQFSFNWSDTSLPTNRQSDESVLQA